MGVHGLDNSPSLTLTSVSWRFGNGLSTAHGATILIDSVCRNATSYFTISKIGQGVPVDMAPVSARNSGTRQNIVNCSRLAFTEVS